MFLFCFNRKIGLLTCTRAVACRSPASLLATMLTYGISERKRHYVILELGNRGIIGVNDAKAKNDV